MKENKTCKICNKTFTRRNYMLKHMENIHSKKYSCPKCFRLLSGAMQHSCAVENGRFLCYARDCSLRFSNGMAMRLHIRDCHRNLDEGGVGEVIKTKRGIRELVQILCKKINLIYNCFDELKYEVDTIAGFLYSKGYSYQNKQLEVSQSKKKIHEVAKDSREQECPEEYEEIDYIDEEYDDKDIEKVSEMEDENMVLDFCAGFGNTQTSESAEHSDNNILSSSIEVPPPLNTIAASSSASIVSNRSRNTIIMPQKTTMKSRLITELPARLLNSNIKHNSLMTSDSTVKLTRTKQTPSETITKASSTPPLFLKIQYDQETTSTAMDPKITFHFDLGETRPPDGDQAEF